ncbi:MAG: hypothetical protein P1U63_12615 [Coxiellaceae bacterium]|nr:hypothetical protein [Coxiellaceae bacterium]
MSRSQPAFIGVIPAITASLLKPSVDRGELVTAMMSANTADYVTAINAIADPAMQQQAQLVILLHLMTLTMRGSRIKTPKLDIIFNKLLAQTRAVLTISEPELIGQVMDLQFDLPAISDEDKAIFNRLLMEGAVAHAGYIAADLFSQDRADSPRSYDMVDKENVLMLIEHIATATSNPAAVSVDVPALASSMAAVLAPTSSATSEADQSDADDIGFAGGDDKWLCRIS